MKRPSITLACIMKNEAHNIPRLLKSVEGCFDEIVFTDTGSTDGSSDVARSHGVTVRDFAWVDDFSAARNASFEGVRTDYVAWLDLDDVLENPEGFLNFRNDAMGLCDYWLASYHYSSDAAGKAMCTFARERVFRVLKGYQWKYFVHEGVMPDERTKMQFSPVWAVRHMRSDSDLQQDRLRNLSLFTKPGRILDSRMTYYYGKELFECGKPAEAIPELAKALADIGMQMHDRILAMQYLCYAYVQTNQMDQAIQIATQGTILAPQRAEFYNLIGDCLIKQGRLADAVPVLSAAKVCQIQASPGYASPLFHTEEAYTTSPRVNLAKIYANLGEISKAEAEAAESAERWNHEESRQVLTELRRIKTVMQGFKSAVPCDDIVITCPPQAPYLWDAQIAKTKSMGGSETACIEMASWLHQLTGRRVLIFNVREDSKTCDGVEYIPCGQVNDYMAKHRPWVHIAWRHNIKLTDAPTFLWCHDLYTPGGEVSSHYDQMLCLTPFHKRFVMASQGVPSDKITVTRNGIKPERFMDAQTTTANPFASRKNPHKIVFPSSPDRGLDRAMKVLDKVREKYPALELHVFYGIEHLHKWGHAELQARLKTMMEERPWVKYHGATQQDVLMDHFKEAVIWLHPCDFIESSCITAMEMVCAGVYPVTRRLGGLQDTLAWAEKAGMATLLDSDCVTDAEFKLYVDATLEALDQQKWKDVKVDPKDYSWESVAQEWIRDILPKEAEIARECSA